MMKLAPDDLAMTTIPALEPSAAEELRARDSAKITAVVHELLAADVSYNEARRRLLFEFEQRYVEQKLVAHRGNVTRAAAASGLARRNFQMIRARRRQDPEKMSATPASSSRESGAARSPG
jgi:hypothetical protein